MRSYAHFARVLLFIGVAVLQAQTCQADLIAGSLTFDAQADQTIRIPTGSPLTGAPFNISADSEFDLSAHGSISIGWAADDDGDQSTVLSSFSANFSGANPSLGSFMLAAVGTGPGATFSGRLDNIVESSGALVSADWTLNTTFDFIFPGAPDQPHVYTRDLATFTGVIRGGDATIGEVFTSNGDINGYLSLGNPASDPLAAVSFNRTITAVPEPSGLALLAGLGGVVALRRRRR